MNSSILSFKKDLTKHQPEWLVLVPLVLEKVVSGVQDKLQMVVLLPKVLSRIISVD